MEAGRKTRCSVWGETSLRVQDRGLGRRYSGESWRCLDVVEAVSLADIAKHTGRGKKGV